MSALRCVVLGAGLMGRLMAFALAKQGHQVEVHEAQGSDAMGAAARIAAAMLAPLAESAITETSVVRMGHHSIGRWQSLLADLPEPVFSQRNGSLIVWHRQDAPLAKQFEQMLRQTGRDCPELAPLEKTDGARLADLERERVRLSERYGEKHPEIQRIAGQITDTRRQLDNEVDRNVAAIKADYMASLEEEKRLAMKRLYFRLVDPQYRLPSKGEFESFLRGPQASDLEQDTRSDNELLESALKPDAQLVG